MSRNNNDFLQRQQEENYAKNYQTEDGMIQTASQESNQSESRNASSEKKSFFQKFRQALGEWSAEPEDYFFLFLFF